MDRLIIDQRTVPALQIFDQEIVVAIQKFTWRDENDGMIGTDADIIDLDVALRGSADYYLRLIKRKKLRDDTVNQQG